MRWQGSTGLFGSYEPVVIDVDDIGASVEDDAFSERLQPPPPTPLQCVFPTFGA